jgi:topoisomerase-4 subunit B
MQNNAHNYDEDKIRTLDWREHIRLRPGMYIGKLGNGSAIDDGIYILVKEVIDNALDEHMMGFGKTIEISVSEYEVTVKDYGRGVPLGKVVDVVSKMNTGAKYDSETFQKSVGLNGVGTKAVNALSSYFLIESTREGKARRAEFEKGALIKETEINETKRENGTTVIFRPDDTIFKNFHFRPEFLDDLLWNYVYLNVGLVIIFNGQKYVSKNGLKDLLGRNTNEEEIRYPIIHCKGADIEVAIKRIVTIMVKIILLFCKRAIYHTRRNASYQAFREALVKTVSVNFIRKNYDSADIRAKYKLPQLVYTRARTRF